MQTRATTVKQAVISVLKDHQEREAEKPSVIRLASEVATSLAEQHEDCHFCYVVHRLDPYDRSFFVRALAELAQHECITIHADQTANWLALHACYTLTEQNRVNLNLLQ